MLGTSNGAFRMRQRRIWIYRLCRLCRYSKYCRQGQIVDFSREKLFMQFPAVNWHEGLFLQPHHFQAWDRHWTERVSAGEQWLAPHGYGVLELTINNDALASGYLQVDALRCRTPGGSLIEWSTGSLVDRRDLRAALDSVSSANQSQEGRPSTASQRGSDLIEVYIGVPRLVLGNRNVDAAEHRNGSRFRAQWLDLPDELDAACVKPVELRELNARVLLSTDDLAGYDILRIARVRRSDEDGVLVRMDNSFIPALIDCSASSLMRNQILSPIFDLMQRCSEQFAKQVLDSGNSLQATSPIDVQRMLVLQVVNPAASVLRVLATSKGIHPFALYVELARLAGALDLLDSKRVSKVTSGYDHENIGGIFFELKQRIFAAIDGLQRAPYRQSIFAGSEHGMQLTIEREQFASIRRWFLGVQKGSVDAEWLHRVMTQGQLDWKLGSVRQVENLFTTRSPGVGLKRCTGIPPTLPNAENWVYYEIEELDRAAWKDVQATGSLAMRVCDSMIAHREKLAGQDSISLIVGKEVIRLQFSLFGVS